MATLSFFSFYKTCLDDFKRSYKQCGPKCGVLSLCLQNLPRRPQRRLTSSVDGSVETFVVFLQACHDDLRRSYRQHTAWMWHELPVDIEREGGDDRYFLVAEILQEFSFSGDAPSRGLEVARYASSHRVCTLQYIYLVYGCGLPEFLAINGTHSTGWFYQACWQSCLVDLPTAGKRVVYCGC